MSQSSLTTPTIVLITGHFSNSAVMLKFLSKRQIPRLGSIFRSPRKTVGPNDFFCVRQSHVSPRLC